MSMLLAGLLLIHATYIPGSAEYSDSGVDPTTEEHVQEPDQTPPLATAAEVWSKPFHQIIGLTRTDWDADGIDDVVILQANGVVSILDPAGAAKATVNIDPESKWPLSLEAGSGPEGPLLLQSRDGWPQKVSIYDSDGNVVAKYPEEKLGGIDSATWVDVDGDGISELAVGFNGAVGLHLVSNQSGLLWKRQDVGNRWCVAGFDAHDGLPGLVVGSGFTDIRVYNRDGELFRKIHTFGMSSHFFVTAEMSSRGDRQILAWAKMGRGTQQLAVAFDLEGTKLWQFPVHGDRFLKNDAGLQVRRAPMHAADVTGDGMKEWLFQTAENEIAVVDTSGQLLTTIDTSAEGYSQVSSIQSMAGPADVAVISTGSKLTAFRVHVDPGN